MIVLKNKEDCCGCKSCEQICPKNCISMKVDHEGFWYPIIDKEFCIECGLCEKACPELLKKEPITPIACYACYTSDEQVRLKSSSGGVFTLLAEYVIAQKGVVFGAKFDTQWNVVHGYTDSVNGLSEFRGSKYVQSDIGSSFAQVRSFLKQGRQVLFTGTPCQVSGLNLFLNKEYENLLTMDFICHGVPSPKVWMDYLNSVIDRSDVIKQISFRNKEQGWKRFSLKIATNTTRILETLDKNLYMKGFLQDLYLRPSCYVCNSKDFKSGSDITVGDFWGIQNEMPEIDDDKGISSVIINSTKGESIFWGLKDLYISEVHLDQITKYNPAIHRSVNKPLRRCDFFENYKPEILLSRLDTLTKRRLSIRLKYKIRSIIKQTLIKLGCFSCIKLKLWDKKK